MKPKLPTVLGVEQEDRGVFVKLKVPQDLFYFEGHFPEFALLPGVVQVHWAMIYMQEYLKADKIFSGFPIIKFIKPIRPKVEVCLHLELSPDKNQLNFNYSNPPVEFSKGRVRLLDPQ